MGERRLRGVIQERRRLLREGLALWVAAQDDLELLGTASTAAHLVLACDVGPVDFVIFEADVDEWDPLATARELRRQHPDLRLVATAGHGDVAREVLAPVACAVVDRRAGMDEVLAAVRGRTPDPRVEVPAPMPDPRVLLTDRQLEILVYVGMGLAAHEIGDLLGISAKTVDNHKQRIYARLGVQSQAHAVAVAMRAGLIPAGGEPRGGFAS